MQGSGSVRNRWYDHRHRRRHYGHLRHRRGAQQEQQADQRSGQHQQAALGVDGDAEVLALVVGHGARGHVDRGVELRELLERLDARLGGPALASSLSSTV